MEAIKARLKGTGYERDHWDAVIDRYRKGMLIVDDDLAAAAVRGAAFEKQQGVTVSCRCTASTWPRTAA